MSTPEQSDGPEAEDTAEEGPLDVRTPVTYNPALDDVAHLPAEEVIEKRPSRAGRDLKSAVGVGVVLGALILGTILVHKVLFLVLVMAAVAVGVWEVRSALAAAGIRAPLVPAVAGSVGMLWAAYAYGPAALTLAWVLTAAGIVLWRGAGPGAGASRDVLGGIFATTYPAFLAGFAILLLDGDDGVARVLTFLVVTVSSDVGGYAAGVVLGKHPLAPTISPKKSWEGFAGSVVLCILTGALTVSLLLDYPWWVGVLLGTGVAVAATVGDLMESLIKRDLGIKDMSNLLPGHGGVMDRLDSLIVVAPVVWVVLALLEPVAR